MSHSTLQSLIARSELFIQKSDARLNDMGQPADRRCRLAAAAFHLALEHHSAVTLLIAEKLYGSALSLVRPTLETFLRGVWLHKIATDDEITRANEEFRFPNLYDLLGSIEKLPQYKSGIFVTIRDRSSKAMHDFTHGGMMHLTRRMTSETIEAAYDDEELIEALNFTLAISCLTAIAMCDVANNHELANEIFNHGKEAFPQT